MHQRNLNMQLCYVFDVSNLGSHMVCFRCLVTRGNRSVITQKALQILKHEICFIEKGEDTTWCLAAMSAFAHVCHCHSKCRFVLTLCFESGNLLIDLVCQMSHGWILSFILLKNQKKIQVKANKAKDKNTAIVNLSCISLYMSKTRFQKHILPSLSCQSVKQNPFIHAFIHLNPTLEYVYNYIRLG